MSAKSSSVSASEFHLFIERVFGFEDPAGGCATAADAASSAPAPLIIPAAPVRLVFANGGVPQLLPATANTAGTEATAQFEPITGRGSRPRLLVVTDPARPARVNGLRVPRLTLLSSGDRFRFDGSCSFRVAIYHRPRLGPVTELIDVPCPVCTIPLAEGDRCLVCPCGTPYHAALDETAEGALACAQMAKICAHCHELLRLEPAYQNSAEPSDE
jgi:hypothetical protein